MTQTTQYVVRADAKQAKAEIASLESQIKSTTNDAVQMGRAVDKAAGPTRNVGQAALETSRALEDLQYGIGGVVNNIPSLVMSLGGTAGLTAAISLAAVGVNQLVKNFGGVDPATKEATRAAAEHVQGLRDKIAGLANDLRALQVGAERAAMETQGEAVRIAAEAAQQALDPLGGIGRFERLKDRTDLPLTIKENVDRAKKAMEKLDAEMATLAGMRRMQLEKQAQRDADLAVDLANAEETRLQNQKKEATKRAEKSQWDAVQNELDLEEKAVNWVAKMREEAIKHKQAQDREALKAEKDAEDERNRLARAAAKERERIREQEAAHAKRMAEEQARYLTQASVNAAAMLGEFAAAAAMGQEAALANLLSAAAQQAGGMIMLEGSKVVGAGIAGMLAAPNPASAAQIAGGLGLVAAGAAIQTGGPAAVSQLMGMAGQSPSGASSGSGRSDPGAAPRSGSSGTGGPLIINVSYGAGGPLPEDIGREIAKAVGGTNRRRGSR